MSVSADYLTYVVDQLTPFAKVVTRRMFGGIFGAAGLFFGHDTLYFKVDDSNRSDYTKRGCAAFQPLPDIASMSYFSVPEHVLEDAGTAGSVGAQIAARCCSSRCSKVRAAADPGHDVLGAHAERACTRTAEIPCSAATRAHTCAYNARPAQPPITRMRACEARISPIARGSIFQLADMGDALMGSINVVTDLRSKATSPS